MRSIEIRPARRSEFHQIFELLAELGRPCDSPGPETRRQAREILDRGDTDVLIAEHDGEVAGLACLMLLPRLGHASPEARLLDLVVSRDRRADGIGRALVAAVSKRASRAGCHVLRLECGNHRQGAQHFYRALGFEDRGDDWQLALPARSPEGV